MPFPRFLQRLLASDGAGPLLRGDILPYGTTADTACQGNDVRLTPYGVCSTAAATAAKLVNVTGFRLTTGQSVRVRFSSANTAANPTLNVNGSGAKAIRYRNAAVAAGVLAADRTYEFVYDGSAYQLVGDVLQVGSGLALSAAGVATVRYGTTADTACQGNDARLTSGEAFRQALIGAPMYLPTTTLPDGFMWADGSLASFADWPELKAKYDAGGFAGMVLAYNASDSDKAAYPGKWVPNAANPTGLFLPRLDGLFFRNWAGGSVLADPNCAAGSYQTPYAGSLVINTATWNACPGNVPIMDALFINDAYGVHVFNDNPLPNDIFPDATYVRPPNVSQPISIYLGSYL